VANIAKLPELLQRRASWGTSERFVRGRLCVSAADCFHFIRHLLNVTVTNTMANRIKKIPSGHHSTHRGIFIGLRSTKQIHQSGTFQKLSITSNARL
jgi:hypothetical protein